MWLTTLERAKQLTRIVVGFTVLALGVALLVLPGPAILIIAVGLAILGAEFVWARRLLAAVVRRFSSCCARSAS